ncbi:hypothetical protein BV22DRAFT_835370 [Leucogyrophana mollusca]|uniref:Uncharacterized protein n=1 Tax=Leucogyrophana mollusca TaxID=85980 RepID=A0ACB8B429_9AGAM|nr:hypothetical protein BV22DRAFT_835370 [Leucogyrophana mollusca]
MKLETLDRNSPRRTHLHFNHPPNLRLGVLTFTFGTFLTPWNFSILAPFNAMIRYDALQVRSLVVYALGPERTPPDDHTWLASPPTHIPQSPGLIPMSRLRHRCWATSFTTHHGRSGSARS